MVDASKPPAPLSVAPMVDRSDRHFRALMRAVTTHTLVYTPMITTHAIIHGPTERLLRFSPHEHPIALQLGGDDPAQLAECAHIGEALGYDEINLNVGCPSSRVQGGNFGAILMRTPERVARCIAAMQARVRVPVTVKHRIGVDELDRYEDMLNFVDVVASAGARRFTVHARKAWLKGLSPKQNRTVPPLRHDEVARLKRERPSLFIETNGGITSLEQAQAHLTQVDAVMMGRAAWDDPMVFAHADRVVFGDLSRLAPTHHQVVRRFAQHAGRELSAGARPVGVLRNLLNVFRGRPGTRRFKQDIAALTRQPWASAAAFDAAIEDALAAQAAAEAEISMRSA